MKGMQLKGARSSVYIEILCDFSLIILTIYRVQVFLNFQWIMNWIPYHNQPINILA